MVREGGSIVLRYPPLPAGIESRSLPELGAGIRSGKNAYWLTGVNFNQESWRSFLIDTLRQVENAPHQNPQMKSSATNNSS